DAGRRWCRGELAREGRIVLSRVRGSRRDVHHARYDGVDTDLRHDHAREGVSRENSWTVLPGQYTLGLGYGIIQRGEGILHRGDVQPGGLKAGDYLRPGGSVREQTMNQNDVSGCWMALRAK